MNRIRYIIIGLLLAMLLGACERPESPNFKLEHDVQAPLSVGKTYSFIGAEDALIDTTEDNFNDIFKANEEGLVRITQEQDFNFGDLSDAIPTIDAPIASVSAQVGTIEITNFNSSGDVGSASFSDITGQSGLQKGDPLPAGSTPGPINISFDTEFFQSATISSNGSLELTLTNNLGFDFDELTVALKAGTNIVGTAVFGTANDSGDNFKHSDTKVGTINIAQGTDLYDLSVDVSGSWDSQTMQADPQDLVVNDVSGQNLVASELTAAPEAQSFSNNGTSTIDESSFEFRESGDFVELDSGDLNIDITNGLDISVPSLTITFQGLQDDMGNSLQIDVTETGAIPRSSTNGGQFSKDESLVGYKITSSTITYTVSATTENVQNGFDSSTDSYRTIYSTDQIDASIGLNNLTISEAQGYVSPRQVLLNTDATNDGQENLDLFNDSEAEVTEIDGISEISDRISDITFANPILSAVYSTNLGVNTTIYAAIAGTDSDGNTVYLTGNSGTTNEVVSGEAPPELQANGVTLDESKLIKFPVDIAENPDPQQGETGSNVFSSDNTNSSEFFSSLPTSIRFIGVAKINEQQQSGTIVNPVIFDPKLGVELPFNFAADNASFKDTLDADLSDLPGNDEEQELSEATLTVNYTNGLPLGLDLSLTFIDENGQVVTTKDGIAISPATTNSDGFVADGGETKSSTKIGFTESQLENLNQSREIQLDITVNTTEQKAVKLRESDTISVQLNMDVKLTSTVN